MFHREMNYGETEVKPTVLLTIDMIKKVLPKYKRHDDLIVINEQAWDEFKRALPMRVTVRDNSPFTVDEDELASLVCQAIQKPVCRRLAIERKVKNDDYRRPTVRLVLGKDGLVQHKDNHITYQFDITKCMFSFGNVSEKLRLSAMDCSNEVVVDLFAGIGYFTLPLLIHSNAKHLYACEWNPDAVESLNANLKINKVQPDRCTVFQGDNRIYRPHGVAQRIVLGILPSCIDYMKTAIECVDKTTGAVLHCHNLIQVKQDQGVDDEPLDRKSTIIMNDHSSDLSGRSPSQVLIDSVNDQVQCNSLSASLIDIYPIKSYAPHIIHAVIDIRVKPIDDALYIMKK